MKSKQQKREDALLRSEAYSKISNEQKIKLLDDRFGKGLGAKRQRSKLNLLNS